MAKQPDLPSNLTRRRALSGVAVAGIGVPLLAACGDDEGSQSNDPSSETTSADTDDAGSGETSPDNDQGNGGGGDALTTTGDVPEGGGTIFADDDVVVTQPSAGDFKAFSATCTHQGCKVSSVEDAAIVCACHMSKFSIEDGSVLDGPASAPLPAKEVTVDGDAISVS